MRLTFGAAHNANGTRRYWRVGRGLRVTEWTREEAARYSQRYTEVCP